MKQFYKQFYYIGKDLNNNTICGEITASSHSMARTMLRKQHINHPKLKRLRYNINANDIAVFTRQLATMQNAGIALIESFTIIIDNTLKQDMANLLTAIKHKIEAGNALSSVLVDYSKYFDNLFCNIIACGEQAGTLDTMLINLAAHQEQKLALQQRLKHAMYYPIMVLSIAIIVSGFLLINVIPVFQELLAAADAKLPVMTQSIIHLSNFITNNLIALLLALISIPWLFSNCTKYPATQQLLQQLLLKLPILGKLLHNNSLYRFTHTLAISLSAGIPLLQALTTVAPTLNTVYASTILSIRDNISLGQPLHTAMRNTKLFPPIMIQMIATGEQAGELDNMLCQLAKIFAEELKNNLAGLSSLLEPIITIILGIIIGSLVIAMYLPLAELGTML